MFNEFLKNYSLYIALVVFSTIIVLIVIFIALPSTKKPKVTSQKIDNNAFYDCLGGQSNIIQLKAEGSRLSVELVDKSLLDIEEIKKLGVDRVIVMSSKVVLLTSKEVIASLNITR